MRLCPLNTCIMKMMRNMTVKWLAENALPETYKHDWSIKFLTFCLWLRNIKCIIWSMLWSCEQRIKQKKWECNVLILKLTASDCNGKILSPLTLPWATYLHLIIKISILLQKVLHHHIIYQRRTSNRKSAGFQRIYKNGVCFALISQKFTHKVVYICMFWGRKKVNVVWSSSLVYPITS